MLSDRDILDEFKQRIAGHFSDSSSQLGDMQPQVARRRRLRPTAQVTAAALAAVMDRGLARQRCMARFVARRGQTRGGRRCGNGSIRTSTR
jgi:hypothetical protein